MYYDREHPENQLHLICNCNFGVHTLDVSLWCWECDEDWELGFYPTLNQYNSFRKRLWEGIKYVFGKKSTFGDFDEVLLHIDDAPKLVALIEKFIANRAGSKKDAILEDIQDIKDATETQTTYRDKGVAAFTEYTEFRYPNLTTKLTIKGDINSLA